MAEDQLHRLRACAVEKSAERDAEEDRLDEIGDCGAYECNDKRVVSVGDSPWCDGRPATRGWGL